MRKLILLPALCGLVLASCSKTELTGDGPVMPTNPDQIHFGSTTTRASINTITNLHGGFKVYAVENGNTSAWYPNIDGTNDYKYETVGATWIWTKIGENIPMWPTTAGSYPMNFYAYYPSTAPTGFAPSATAPSALTADITIQATPADQTDFLAAKNLTESKPGTGNLAMEFKHITSKVNFSIVTGLNVTASVSNVSINNLKNSGTYDYMAATTPWSGITGTGSYSYFKNATPIVNATTTEGFVTPIVAASSVNHHLMLIPQAATAAWDGTTTGLTGIDGTDAGVVVDGAYIEMNYHIQTTGGNNVGFTSRVDCNIESTHTTEFDKYKIGGTYGNRALYIRVGFPMGGPLTWTMGKGYMYNINLGTATATGGKYLSKYYYDDEGNNTMILINGAKVPENVAGDGTIHFEVGVGAWDDKITPVI